MAKRQTPRAASLSEEQRALATAIITDAIVATRQNVAAPPQVSASGPAAIAADQYGEIKRALRTHSEP